MTDPREEFRELESADELGGVRDGFQRLWTPHRMAYIAAGAEVNRGSGCPFCAAPEKSDADGLIVYRGTHAYALMNLFPYTAGHMLICPYRHVGVYDEASPEEIDEISRITQTAMRVMRTTSGCHGFNIGMNQGEVAGAGVEEHLHQHIVPRWRSDANFLPIIGRTKALPQLLGDVRQALADAWPA